ncbi:hypothetical protein MycrhDRAFT_2327 [Mycolicibacterium rhodesiae JS60]|nr:hypothetical protein MycrhDRAFT_2327 [Mycolicibacterium rhodesiae JS60]
MHKRGVDTRAILAGGESLTIEFKSDINDRDLAKAVACLANGNGGVERSESPWKSFAGMSWASENIVRMMFRIDGHEIPIATAEDLTDEERASHDTRRVWTPDDAGRAEMVVPTGHVRGKSVPFNMQHGDDLLQGARFTIVSPIGDDDRWLDLASLRPVRVAGHEHAVADRRHRRRLFQAVGAVTVAGGHVEMALRKVLVSLTGGQNEDLAGKDVSLDWSKLHAKIEKHCKRDPSELAQRVDQLLKAARASTLRDTRNNIVHSYWWVMALDSDEVWSGRYYNRGQEPVCIVDTAENLYQTADKLFEFAAELEALVAPPLAIVPAAGSADLGSSPIDLTAQIDRVDELFQEDGKPGPKATSARVSKPQPGQKPPGRRSGKQRRRRRR